MSWSTDRMEAREREEMARAFGVAELEHMKRTLPRTNHWDAARRVVANRPRAKFLSSVSERALAVGRA